MVNNIDNNNLIEVLQIVCEKSKIINELIAEIGGRAEDAYGGIYLVKDSPINNVFIDIKENKAIYIEFIGLIQIEFKDLIKMFGEYRKVYNHYDDLYLYFFNEKRTYNPYYIKTHFNSNIEPVKENSLIWNLTVYINH